MTPDLVFRDHYLLDFLSLADTYSEQNLENSIIREMERFIIEQGPLLFPVDEFPNPD